MKLLYICEQIDLGLKQRLDQLAKNDIEADCLVLPKFTIYKEWEKEVIQIKDHLSILDKAPLLGGINRSLKYKKLLSSLSVYDSVNIYKCTKTMSEYLQDLVKITKSYFITLEDNLSEKNRAVNKLLQYSTCLLFNSSSQLKKFEDSFGYDEKTLIARNSCNLFSVIDNIKDITLDKFKKYLNLDMEKNIVYCDMGNHIETQFEFLKALVALPRLKLKATTFILDASALALVDKERLIEYITDKSLDYLLPESLLTDEQRAMLLILSTSSIILPHCDKFNILYPSLYIKKHPYYYNEKEDNDKFIKENNLFIDTFENFENSTSYNQGSHNLVSELLKKNSDTIKKLFHHNNNEKVYLEILKIL